MLLRPGGAPRRARSLSHCRTSASRQTNAFPSSLLAFGIEHFSSVLLRCRQAIPITDSRLQSSFGRPTHVVLPSPRDSGNDIKLAYIPTGPGVLPVDPLEKIELACD